MSWLARVWTGDGWTATVNGGDSADSQLAADAVVIDGLRATWSSDVGTFPDQPKPATLTLQLYVPDRAAGPAIYQGQTFDLRLQGIDWDRNARVPFLEFYGRVADCDATPTRDGLTYSLVVTDRLADANEEQIGNVAMPWFQDPFYVGDVVAGVLVDGTDEVSPGSPQLARIPALFDQSALPLTYLRYADFDWRFPGSPATPSLRGRDAELASTLDVVGETLRTAVVWEDAIADETQHTFATYDTRRHPVTRWTRFVLAPHYRTSSNNWSPAAASEWLAGPRPASYGVTVTEFYNRPNVLRIAPSNASDPTGELRVWFPAAPGEHVNVSMVKLAGATGLQQLRLWETDADRRPLAGRLWSRNYAAGGDTQTINATLGASSRGFYVGVYVSNGVLDYAEFSRPSIRCPDHRPEFAGYRLAPVTSGIPVAAGLPYRLAVVAGAAQLTRKPAPAGDNPVVVIPAAVTARGVRWRQDKAQQTNRVRLVGTFDDVNDPRLISGSTELVREFAASVAARGAVEQRVQTEAARSPRLVADVYLGSDYAGVPRWSVDAVTFWPEDIGGDASWPRLFPAAAGHEQPALGKLVLVTDIPDKWNLHTRSDYAGRLVGATVELRKGRIYATAQLLHTIPGPNGDVAANRIGVSAADLVAKGGAYSTLTPAAFGDLTAYDLALTDAPS